MKVTITDIRAKIVDVSTKEAENYMIAYWIIKYEVRFILPYDNSSYNTLEGELIWRVNPIDIMVVINYIKSLFNENSNK